tara:strand:+ start:465 stop:797 length:333 start_codon:yes stop_codon:yes gene_type:complete
MVLDLRRANHCLDAQKRNGTYRDARIGIISRDFPGGSPYYRKGDVVLFSPDFELTEGPYLNTPRKSGTFTVEKPMSSEEIARQRSNRSLLTTFGTTVNVPKSYVDEVLVK